MESVSKDQEEQEVTVEVLPQTVTEIIYLQDSDLTCYTPEQDQDDVESYEVGTVDMTTLPSKSLVLDSTETFVLLESGEEYEESDTVIFDESNTPEETPVIDLNMFPNNSGTGEFICTQCNFTCRSPLSLKSHRLIHDEMFIKCNYNCIVCGQRFDKAQILSHHFRMFHQKPKYVCYICNCSCSDEVTLSEHLSRHEAKKFKCDKCGTVFPSCAKLLEHRKTHDTLLYACNKCDASFSSTQEVSMHLRMEHSKVKIVCKIPVCNENVDEEEHKVDLSSYNVSTENGVEPHHVMPGEELENELMILPKKRKTR